MNASQRRILRRTVHATFPKGADVTTPTGAQAKVTQIVGRTKMYVHVKFKNNRHGVWMPTELKRM